ncbi:MAG: hypothetical protein IJ682_11670 [Lachnospiraceae bacterium]|nr:hypothetical protein [Lachnospiraceae bacterium]
MKKNCKTYDNQSNNGNQTKYGNKKPYNNIPPATGEELAPILMTKEMFKDRSIIKDNIETWNIHGHRIPVAFAPIAEGTLDSWMKFFNAQVRTYIGTGGTSDFPKENGHEDDLSYDKFQEDAAADEDSDGFELADLTSLEDTVLLGIIIKDLIAEVKKANPKYGRILELLGMNYSKGQILKELKLGKSQGYEDIKAAQKMARDLYNKD